MTTPRIPLIEDHGPANALIEFTRLLMRQIANPELTKIGEGLIRDLKDEMRVKDQAANELMAMALKGQGMLKTYYARGAMYVDPKEIADFDRNLNKVIAKWMGG